MIFRPQLAAAIVRGEKTATRRLPVDNPRSPWRAAEPLRHPVGSEFAIQPGRGAPRVADAVVTRRAVERLDTMTVDDARREGFASLVEFCDAWRAINGSFNPATRVHVIEFKLVGSDCMGCDGTGWCEGSPAFSCPDCFATGVEVTARARALIDRLETEATAERRCRSAAPEGA